MYRVYKHGVADVCQPTGYGAGGGSRAAAWRRQTNVNMTSRDCRRRIGITVTVNGRLNLRLAKWQLIFVGATFLA